MMATHFAIYSWKVMFMFIQQQVLIEHNTKSFSFGDLTKFLSTWVGRSECSHNFLCFILYHI